MAGVVLLVLVSLLLVTKEDGAGGHGAQRRVPRAVDRVVTGAVLALVAGGVPEPIGGFAGGLEGVVFASGRLYVQAEAALQGDGVWAAAGAGEGEGGVRGHLQPGAGAELGGGDEARGLAVIEGGVGGGGVEAVRLIEELEPPVVVQDCGQRLL